MLITCVFYLVCRHNDIEYEEGAVIQPNISTICTCRKGFFQCDQQRPSPFNGPTCIASGDPHYHTFDQRYFDFQGTCEYILTKPCDVPEFEVIVSNGEHNSHVSCTDTVRVVVPGENLDILLGRGGAVTINDRLHSNNGDEVMLTSGGVEVVRVGGRPNIILTELGVRVSWDGLYRVEVTVSTSWRGRLCGLCGNYNGDPDDDFMTPDGSLESSPNTFGLSWVWNNNTYDTCGGLAVPETCSDELMDEAESRCGVMTGERFGVCNNVLNATTFVESCVFDYCYGPVTLREGFYFNSVATYASACARIGVFIPGWRDSNGKSFYWCLCLNVSVYLQKPMATWVTLPLVAWVTLLLATWATLLLATWATLPLVVQLTVLLPYLQDVHQGWYINNVVHCVLKHVIILEHQIVQEDVLKDVSVLMDKCF